MDLGVPCWAIALIASSLIPSWLWIRTHLEASNHCGFKRAALAEATTMRAPSRNHLRKNTVRTGQRGNVPEEQKYLICRHLSHDFVIEIGDHIGSIPQYLQLL